MKRLCAAGHNSSESASADCPPVISAFEKRLPRHGKFLRSLPPAPADAETMNVPKIMAVAALFSGSVQAEQRVTIYFQDGAIAPGQTLVLAEGLAGEMFTKAGVCINWRVGHPNGEAITVGMSDAPSSYHPGALAFALPYQGFHGLLRPDTQKVCARSCPGTPGPCAGSANYSYSSGNRSALGNRRHEAHWTPADSTQMLAKLLPFTDWDVELIQEGLASRDVRMSQIENTQGCPFLLGEPRSMLPLASGFWKQSERCIRPYH
jgi:hypothetical protein